MFIAAAVAHEQRVLRTDLVRIERVGVDAWVGLSKAEPVGKQFPVNGGDESPLLRPSDLDGRSKECRAYN